MTTKTNAAFDGMANEFMPILMKCSDVFHEWTFEYPGYVALRTDGGGVWNIGTAGGTWAADLYIDETSFVAGEQPDHSIDTGIPADCEDAERIAAALYREMSTLGS